MDDIVPFCGNCCHRLSSRCRSVLRSLFVLMLGLLRTDVEALQVIGGSVTVQQGGTAILPCHVIDTSDDLTQITWQRRTREKPHNDNFLTILPRDGPLFVNGDDDRFKYIGNFNAKNGTLQLSNVALKDEGSYTCIFTLFPSGNQKTEIPLNLLVPPFTSIKDNLPTLGTEEVLFATCMAAGSRPPAEVRWLTGALGDKVTTTTNSTQYDNGTTTTVSSLFGIPTRETNGQQVQCVISGDSLTKEETLPFIIQVYFSPTEVNIRAISGDSFECLTEANPNAKLTWSRSGQSLLESAVKVEGAKLQLLSRTSDLNGLYECEASNAYGSKRGHLYVHVTSGACSVAWALFGVLVFTVTGAAAWYFYNSGYRLRRSDNTPDDDNTPDSEHVQLRAFSAGDDHGPHDVPPSPSSAHDDHGLPSRPDDDHAPEDDRRHEPLSTSSSGGDHGPRDIPPSLSSAKDDHGPSRRPDR